jgi:hypothetical protein
MATRESRRRANQPQSELKKKNERELFLSRASALFFLVINPYVPSRATRATPRRRKRYRRTTESYRRTSRPTMRWTFETRSGCKCPARIRTCTTAVSLCLRPLPFALPRRAPFRETPRTRFLLPPRISEISISSSGIRDDNPRQQRDKDQSRAKTQQKRPKQVPPSSFVQSLSQQSRVLSKPFRASPESRRFSLYAFESIRLPRGVDNRAMNGVFHVS